MKNQYSHLIAVPARSSTVKAELMERLASQMNHLDKPFSILAMPEGDEKDVVKTAELLEAALKKMAIPATKEVRPITLPLGKIDDERTKKVLGLAFDPAPKAKTLIIVIELQYAERIPGVFLWEFLENRRIIQGVTNRYSPGEAGIVDCTKETRDCLHPQGYVAWVGQVLAGQA